MIKIKDTIAIEKMVEAGKMLASIFEQLKGVVAVGITTADIDRWLEKTLQSMNMVSQSKGYHGYRHVSCISVNNEVVHGVPHDRRILQEGDMVKIDVCASYKGYCADMARPFLLGQCSPMVIQLTTVAQSALDAGIRQAIVSNTVGDISRAIQEVVEKADFGIVRTFSGHGIGTSMHEEPNVPNYGNRERGIMLRPGMALAIEPMITENSWEVIVDRRDKWTVRTVDGGLAAHVEDTVIILDNGPLITTRNV